MGDCSGDVKEGVEVIEKEFLDEGCVVVIVVEDLGCMVEGGDGVGFVWVGLVF